MPDNSENNKRIAKNSIFLYFRMILVLIVTLYTSRVVLDALGVDDFGIYNVVGGVASLLTFFTAALTNATQRYLSYSIGRKDEEGTQNIFNLSILLYAIISAVLFIALETLGLWLVNTQLVIPESRMVAANWVYQCSIILCLMTVMQVPYLGMIISKERMNVYAYVGIFDVIAKLLIVYLLFLFPDKLIAYAILFVIEWICINLIYISYCHKNFIECRVKFFWDKSLAKEIMNFISLTAFGCLSWSVAIQGGSIVLNMFFGPVVNAARGLAIQINSGITTFTNGIITAIKPQLIKSYASGDLEYMKSLFCVASKYSAVLMLLLSLPIIFNIDYILSIWLKEVPDYTNIFTILIIIDALIALLVNPINIVLNGVGKIKVLQFYGRIITLSSLPITYILLKLSIFNDPTIVFYMIILAEIAYLMVCFWDMNRHIGFGIFRYVRNVLFPIILTAGLACTAAYYATQLRLSPFWEFVFISVVAVVSVLLSTCFFVATNAEKTMVFTFIRKRINHN